MSILLSKVARRLMENDENRGIRPVDRETIGSALREQCSEILDLYKKNPSFRIHRGDDSVPDYGYLDPRGNDRKSRNTNNVYTSLVAASSAWKDAGIPLRNKSIICSTSERYSRDYGQINIVFPVNGARIAWGTARDNWDNYKRGSLTVFGVDSIEVDDFNGIISRIFDTNFSDDSLIDSSPQEIVGGLEKLDAMILNGTFKYIESQYDYRDTNAYVKKILEFGGFIKAAQTYIDPSLNEIKVTTIKDPAILPTRSDSLEVWTDAPCYFIDKELAHSFIKTDYN